MLIYWPCWIRPHALCELTCCSAKLNRNDECHRSGGGLCSSGLLPERSSLVDGSPSAFQLAWDRVIDPLQTGNIALLLVQRWRQIEVVGIDGRRRCWRSRRVGIH